MYYEGIKGDYHWSPNERIFLSTTVRKTKIEYGTKEFRCSLVCNCTPEVAVYRVKSFPSEFEKKTGWRFLDNVRMSVYGDMPLFTFLGTVYRDRVALDLPVVLGKRNIFDEILNEIKFQEQNVKTEHGKYSYYDGRNALLFDSFEDLLDWVSSTGYPEVREYFGDEYLQLFPGSNSYFRNFKKSTVYVVNDTSIVVDGPGIVISITPNKAENIGDPVGMAKKVLKEIGAVGGQLTMVGDRVIRGEVFKKEGRNFLLYDINGNPVYSESVLDAAENLGAAGALVDKYGGVLYFGDYVIVVLEKRGIVQRVDMKLKKPRYGTLYRVFKFAPHPDGFSVRVMGNVFLAAYMAQEKIMII